MPLLPTLLRLLLVAALAVNGWVLPAHAMPAGPSATATTHAAGAGSLDAAAAAVAAVSTGHGAMTAAPATASGCHDAAAPAGHATPGDAPDPAAVAVEADGDCCDADSCSDCRCAMAGSIAPAPAARLAALRPVAAPSTGATTAPRARLAGQPLRPPIA